MEFYYQLYYFIKQDVFGGFLIYSLLFFIIKTFVVNDRKYKEIDKKVLGFMLEFGSIISVILLLYLVILNIFVVIPITPSLLELLLWVIILNSLRINFFKKYLIPRIIIGFFVVINFEVIAIVIAAFNSYNAWSDEQGFPSRWFDLSNLNITAFEILIGILVKISILILASYVYFFLKKQILLLYKNFIN